MDCVLQDKHMQQTSSQQADDIVFIERRREPRIIVSIPARYAFAKRYDTNGNRHELACRIVNISLRSITLVVPVNGAIGDWIFAHCDEFGKLEGTIIRVLHGGFVMTIVATDAELAKLATKIELYEKIKNHDLPDGRKHKRIVPKNPRSTLFFGDDRRLECFVIDFSASGVALSADIKPKIGTPLAVGTLVGRVVRHFATGFAVQFIQLQDIDGLEQRFIQS
jgi:hypothetical protein